MKKDIYIVFHALDNKISLTILVLKFVLSTCLQHLFQEESMPIYEYQCKKCGTIEEALQKFSDKPLTKCRHCSGKLHKLVSRSSFHLKGTGWYVTDYANISAAAEKKSPKTKEPTAPKNLKNNSLQT